MINGTGRVTKSTSSYQKTLAGVITLNSKGTGYNNPNDDRQNNPSFANVGMLGHIAVKVNTENGPIKVGDYLTSSSTPGVAMKATEPGQVIGKALEDYSGNNRSHKIIVLVNITWADPTIDFTASGDIITVGQVYYGLLSDTSETDLKNIFYQVKDSAGNIVSRVGTFKDIATGGLKASLIDVQNLISDTAILRQVKVTEKFISPQADINSVTADNVNIKHNLEVDNIKTNYLSPLSGDDLAINLNENSKFTVKDNDNKIVASIDNHGKASFSELIVSGNTSFSETLTSNKLKTDDLTANYATISGELFAQSARFKSLNAEKIRASSIEGLEDRIAQVLSASISAQTANTNNPTANSTDPLIISNMNSNSAETATTSATLNNNEMEWEKQLEELITRLNLSDLATASGTWKANTSLNIDSQLATQNIDAETGLFNTFLGVTGQASITTLAVNNTLTINQSMHLSANSLEVVDGVDNTLYIQPSGLGKINLLAGAVVIDDMGNMHVNGDLYLAGNITAQSGYFKGLNTQTATISGNLFANLIKPTNNLAIDLTPLASDSAVKNPKLEIKNSNSTVASIDASGSATLRKIIIADAKQATSSGLLDSALNPTVASNATAGTATLPAGQSSITIQNKNITNNSLIYITPTSNTYNKVLFIKNKISQDKETIGSFTVSINSALPYPVEFNWWIIN